MSRRIVVPRSAAAARPLPASLPQRVRIQATSPPAPSPPKKSASPVHVKAKAAVSPSPANSPLVMSRQKSAAIDDTLDELMNPRKLKPLKLNRDDPDQPLGSPLQKHRREVMKQLSQERRSSPTPSEGSAAAADDQDDDDQPPLDEPEEGVEDEQEEEDQEEEDDEQQTLPQRKVIDPLEQEMQRAVRKAKLLARITQLAKRGIKPTKTPTWNASEQELMVEVARMEVIAARSVRIEQGRAALMMTVGVGESGCNYVDRNYLKDTDYHIGMDGYSDHLLKDIQNFDDVLERGMDSMLGPPGQGSWWRELGFMLTANMAMYRINKGKRKTEAEERREMMEELKKSPEFRQAIAKEIVEEMRRQHTEDNKKLQEQLEQQKLLNEAAKLSQPPAPPASARMRPPASSLAKPAAREDIPAEPSQTQAMMSEFNVKPSIASTTAPVVTRSKEGGIVIDATHV